MLTTFRRRAEACGSLVLRRGKLFTLSAVLVAIDVGPDLLTAVAGVDWNPLLPEGWGVKAGGWLAVARLALPIVKANLRKPPAPPEPRP